MVGISPQPRRAGRDRPDRAGLALGPHRRLPVPSNAATPATGPPDRREILDEAKANAELGEQGIDLGGQVMQARFVLEWLTGKIDALPLWNGGPKNLSGLRRRPSRSAAAPR